MAYSVNTTTYNKAARYPIGHGYGVRPRLPSSIVVHSTNNSKTTTFASEADYLYRSRDVSADYLIGKDNRIVRFLDSRIHQAWHAGGQQADGTWTAQPAFANQASIGIELHHSLPDPPYPAVQLDALGWLLQQLADQFDILPSLIETHGQIALPGPYERKHDPADWPHAEFVAWRDALFAVPDRLRARTLPGVPGQPPVYCSVKAADFYAARGGLPMCGYPLINEFHDASLNCDVLVCERVVIKESAAFGVEQALLSEARREGWLP